jgi:hypothetical protein
MIVANMSSLVHLVPGEPPRFLVVTPGGKIHARNNEHGHFCHQRPHGLWKRVPDEEYYVMAFFNFGALAMRPQCYLLAQVPFVSGLLRDHQHLSLVVTSPRLDVVGDVAELHHNLAAKFACTHRTALPCVRKLLLWLHAGRFPELVVLLANRQVVWAAFGPHGDTDDISVVSPANGTHTWFPTADHLRVWFHCQGYASRAVERTFVLYRQYLWYMPGGQCAMVELY